MDISFLDSVIMTVKLVYVLILLVLEEYAYIFNFWS